MQNTSGCAIWCDIPISLPVISISNSVHFQNTFVLISFHSLRQIVILRQLIHNLVSQEIKPQVRQIGYLNHHNIVKNSKVTFLTF